MPSITPNQMKKKTESVLLFDRSKYMLIIAGLLITAVGFILMIGGGSPDPEQFSYELFSFRRITLAPFLVLAGYGLMIYGILKKGRLPEEPKVNRKK